MERGTDLSKDRHLVADAGAPLQPLANNRFGFSTLVARPPGRIDVGGVNGVEAMIDEGVEYLEASLLVDRPPENIAAEVCLSV